MVIPCRQFRILSSFQYIIFFCLNLKNIFLSSTLSRAFQNQIMKIKLPLNYDYIYFKLIKESPKQDILEQGQTSFHPPIDGLYLKSILSMYIYPTFPFRQTQLRNHTFHHHYTFQEDCLIYFINKNAC